MILIIFFLVTLLIQECLLTVMFNLEIDKVSLIVFLEPILNLFVLWKSFVILWLALESGQTLLGDG
jgi:hypothetical protein